MTAGTLTERITFHTPASTPDGYGGHDRGPHTLYGSAWCDIRPTQATEIERAGSPRELTIYLIKLRRRTDLTTAMQVHWRGRKMRLREIRLPAAREPMMEIVAEYIEELDL